MCTFTGRKRHPRRVCSEFVTAIGTTGLPLWRASRPTPRRGRASDPVRMRVPSGKITTAWPRSSRASAVAMDSSSEAPRLIGNAPRQLRIQPRSGFLKSSRFATK